MESRKIVLTILHARAAEETQTSKTDFWTQ